MIAEFTLGSLPREERPAIESHIEKCLHCRELVDHLLGETSVAIAPVESSTKGAHFLKRGASLGRYLLLKCIGRGGGGTVYAAYDPELDRKIAIKLIHAQVGEDEAQRQRHLFQEAKALAKVSHPNVIAVHDIGTFEGQVFVAMDFVDGVSLREWLRAKLRPWREIVKIFLQAAQGLSAAHQAGLVHRDFKAENVLVSEDGEVRVTDFGLAIAADQSGAARRHVGGTPRYLAPEQWAGEAGTAYSDQFSFCASLFEALYGVLPYPGSTSAGFSGKVVEPERRRSVPNWIWRVLTRGLSVDPKARFASIDELASALQAGLRTKNALTAAVLATIAIIAVAWVVNQGTKASAVQKVRVDLSRAAESIRQKALDQQRLIESGIEEPLRRTFLLDALGKASDLDASLGLSEDRQEQGLIDAHEVIRSADLPILKNAELLLFVDRSARLVYERKNESLFGRKLAGVEAIARALSGEPNEALWSAGQMRSLPLELKGPDDNDLFLMIARPVGRAPRPLGVLLIGYSIRRSLLPALEAAGAGHAVIHGFDGSKSSLFFRPELAARLAHAEDGTRQIDLDGRRYLVRNFDLPGLSEPSIGRVSLLRNVDDEIAAILAGFRSNTLRVVLGLIAVVWLAYGFSHLQAYRRHFA